MFGRRQKAAHGGPEAVALRPAGRRGVAERAEELEVFQVLFRGAAALAAHCESGAVQRGSPAAHASGPSARRPGQWRPAPTGSSPPCRPWTRRRPRHAPHVRPARGQKTVEAEEEEVESGR